MRSLARYPRAHCICCYRLHGQWCLWHGAITKAQNRVLVSACAVQDKKLYTVRGDDRYGGVVSNATCRSSCMPRIGQVLSFSTAPKARRPLSCPLSVQPLLENTLLHFGGRSLPRSARFEKLHSQKPCASQPRDHWHQQKFQFSAMAVLWGSSETLLHRYLG